MEQEDQRNFIIAMVLMIAFVWAYQTFIIEPQTQARRAAQDAAAEQQAEAAVEAGAVEEPLGPAIAATVEDALIADARIPFDGPGVDGSIRVAGARIDDLNLKRHFLTVERAQELRLFRPENAENGYYASYYWLDETGRALAGLNADWVLVSGQTLRPDSPVTLRLDRSGVVIDRTISLDDNYMFTFEDTVTNTGAEQRILRPYGSIRRHGEWKSFLEATDPGSAADSAIVHQGLIGVLGGELKLRKYKGLSQGKGIKGDTVTGEGGWLGFTDKYWMGALAPDQAREFTGEFARRARDDGQVLEVKTEGAEYVLAPGDSVTAVNRVFAGAKKLSVLKAYEDTLDLPRFDDAVDWGFLYFLTKPFFQILLWLQGQLGSFGWAILAFTVLVKLPLIPLYNTELQSHGEA